MNEEFENIRVTNFKNDIMFKYLLSDNKNEKSMYLLKLIIENITDVKCKDVTVLNPNLNPENADSKNMTVDVMVKTITGEIINVEMQNSRFSPDHYRRFQMYGSNMLIQQCKRGDTNYVDNVHKVYQIIFIDDIDKDNDCLIDTYLSMNKSGNIEKENMAERTYVQLPYIDKIVKERGVRRLSSFEILVYIFKNGLDGDILRIEDEVVKIMKEMEDTFNEDTALRLSALNQEWARVATRNATLAEGELKGEKRGKFEKQKELTLKFFKQKYPKEDISILEDLTLEQYEQIFEMLIKDVSIEEIKKIIK